MTCGKREDKGKRLSFRQQAKEWIGRILGEEFCRPVGCETQFGAAEKTEAEKWETTQESLDAATWSVVLALGGCVRTARAILGLGSMSVNRIEWCTSGAGWCTEPNRVS